MLTGNHHSHHIRFRHSIIKGIRTLMRRRHKAQSVVATSQADSAQWSQTFWGRKFMQSATLLLALVCSASLALADVKITTKSSASGQTMSSTTYIKGARQRTEGLGFTTIYQCDLKRMIQINDKNRTYLITPLGGSDNNARAPQAKSGARRGGVVTYHTINTDTGETKQMLGLTAKRIKSRLVIEASEGACQSMNMEMETDGWYASISDGMSCQSEAASSFPTDQSECVDEIRFKTTGVANTGYPIMTTTKIKFNTGAEMQIPDSSSTQEVTDISNVKLDAALFEAPAGYREVKSAQELGSPY